MSSPDKKNRLPFALILIEWLCFLDTRRVIMRFHLSGDTCTRCPLKADGEIYVSIAPGPQNLSRYLRFVMTAVLPSKAQFSALPIRAPLRYASHTNCRTSLEARPRLMSESTWWKFS